MTRRIAFHLIALACFAVPNARGFGGIVVNHCSSSILLKQMSLQFSTAKWKLYSKEKDEEEFKFDPNMPVIMRGSQEDEISDEVWENVDTGEPPKLVIMKQVSFSSPKNLCFLGQTHSSFSTCRMIASWNQHLYVYTGRSHCCVSDVELRPWSWLARPSAWNEGCWHLYGCFHFVARHYRPEQSRLSFMRLCGYRLIQ